MHAPAAAQARWIALLKAVLAARPCCTWPREGRGSLRLSGGSFLKASLSSLLAERGRLAAAPLKEQQTKPETKQLLLLTQMNLSTGFLFQGCKINLEMRRRGNKGGEGEPTCEPEPNF